MKLTRTATAVIAGSAALVLALTGCATDGNGDATANGTATATTGADGSVEAAEDGVSLTEAYIKEKPADKGMTGVFGIFTNNTDEDVTIAEFRVEGLAEDTVFEQHDSADGQMFEVPEGLTIPANGTLELAPGGKHLMIMDNMEELAVGEAYTLVVELSDGSTLTQDIDVRVQPAGEEDYGEDGSLTAPGEARPDASMDGDDEHAGH